MLYSLTVGLALAVVPLLASLPELNGEKESNALVDIMAETRKWLKEQRLTKVIPLFEENEVDLESVAEMSKEEFDQWVFGLADIDIMQAKRLKKSAAILRMKHLKNNGQICLRANEIKQSCSQTDATASVATPNTDFFFDLKYKTEWVVPEYFDVSSDLKTVRFDTSMNWPYYIILNPEMHSGTHSVQFKVEKITGTICVGVTDAFDKSLKYGCQLCDNGNLYTSGSWVSRHDSFGGNHGWHKGDIFTLTVGLDCGRVSLKTPYGAKTIKWQPKTTPIRIGISAKKGSIVTVIS